MGRTQPAEQSNPQTVQAFLEASRKLREMSGHKHGFESLVLTHGRHWPNVAIELPDGVTRGQMKQCFMNAGRLALGDPARFTYVEGYAAGVMPVLHAWCVDNDGQVIDPTWCGSSLGTDYFGIPFRTHALRRLVARSGCWGLLDCPPDFPLLTMSEEQLVALTVDTGFAKGGVK